jgi:hypothetical protein
MTDRDTCCCSLDRSYTSGSNRKNESLPQCYCHSFNFLWGGGELARLRHNATSRKVPGSRLDEINEFFQLSNPSSHARPWVYSASHRNGPPLWPSGQSS